MLTMRGNRKSSSSLSTGGSVNFTRALKSSIYNHHCQWQCHHFHLSTPFQQYLIEWCFLHGIFITIIPTIMVATLVELRRLMRKCPIEDCSQTQKLSIQSQSQSTLSTPMLSLSLASSASLWSNNVITCILNRAIGGRTVCTRALSWPSPSVKY